MRLVHNKIANEYAKKRIIENRTQLNTQDYKDIAVRIYGENVKPLSYIQCRKAMSMPEVKKIAELRIMDLLERNNIKPDKPFDLLKKAEEIATKKENSSDLIKIADKYLELHDLKPNKTVIKETRQYNNTDLSTIEGTISKELESKRKVTVSTTVNNTDIMGSNND